MDLRRGSSDSSLPHLIEEGVIFDPTIPLPDLRNLPSTSTTLQPLNSHLTTAQAAPGYDEQIIAVFDNQGFVSYLNPHPIPIIIRPVSQQVAYEAPPTYHTPYHYLGDAIHPGYMVAPSVPQRHDRRPVQIEQSRTVSQLAPV